MTYVISDTRRFTPGPDNPVLLSYIDVVAQGCLQTFGIEGLQGFFDSSHNWDVPILDDRSAPPYPRHQRLDLTERQLVDDLLIQKAPRRHPERAL